jgi:hypothetical protein
LQSKVCTTTVTFLLLPVGCARGWSQFYFVKLLLAHAAWIAAESPVFFFGIARNLKEKNAPVLP